MIFQDLQRPSVETFLKKIDQPPKASAMVNSMRSIGYSFEAAVADIFDNSLAAGSALLQLEIRRNPTYVAFIDDGVGMSTNTLLDAMRLGSSSPLEQRRKSDHGRFGMGLKTASLSQCRRLTVISKNSCGVSAARWDLNVVEETESWCLLLLEPEDYAAAPCFQTLEKQSSGTLVIWEEFDRISSLGGEGATAESLVRLVSESSEHISLIFHRLMDGSAAQKIEILLNGTRLTPADPFFLNNSYTRLAGRETAVIDGSPISAIAYILPRLNQVSSSQLKAAGGAAKLRDLQGFFVYRNFRLITYGTWFRLANREELTRLARIQVDIDNTSDAAWQLDIKKATVFPSARARRFLATMVAHVADGSVRRFKPSVSAAQVIENAAIWLRVPRHDMVHFKINRAHPIIVACLTSMPGISTSTISAMLDALELSLPIAQLYYDQAANHNVTFDDEHIEDRLRKLFSILSTDLTPNGLVELIDDLPYLEPFRSHPTVTARLQEG